MRKALLILIFIFSIGYSQKTTVYTIGDSTMADERNITENPGRGWAQMLQQFFKDEIIVDNRAVGGRSTRSYIDELRWDSVYNGLKPGDYVFIQFGHNDQTQKDPKRFTNPHTAYRYNLMRFVNETKEKEATPILLSPIVRRDFNEHGALISSFGAYSLETRLVAQEYEVPFIDLQYLTEMLEESYGLEKSKVLHIHFEPKENSFYPDGIQDNTHLSVKGATEVARLVAEQIKKMKIPLADKVK